MKKIICIDFDGVMHSYTSGWQGVDVVSDPPVDGALVWLEDLLNNPEFEPVIYSSRSKEEVGILAMKDWFSKHGLPATCLETLQFPTQKPAAWLTIDDRAICFEGYFPEPEAMSNFKPWNKR